MFTFLIDISMLGTGIYSVSLSYITLGFCLLKVSVFNFLLKVDLLQAPFLKTAKSAYKNSSKCKITVICRGEII